MTVIDTNSDWTLSIATGPWHDPFEGCDVNDPGWDLGRWTLDAVGDEQAAIVGHALRDAMPRFNEVGELSGIDLEFGGYVLRVQSWGGEVRASVEPVARGRDAE
ncbi:hypothetical protein ACFVJS_11235 [Nocardioides sp. NPDC057772]|uniref:hypothetical protein n=1 Tax=Nocardioides sp. NPDC057772 TaxID=3346245 RepID=UPI0036731CE8